MEVEGLGVAPPELEDVADLDTARSLQSRAAYRAWIAVVDVGDVDRPVGSEVPAGDEADHVVAVAVGAGDPGRAGDDARVDEETDAGRGMFAERARPDVALGERRDAGEVLVGERLGLGGEHGGLEPLDFDVTIAGYTDRQRLPCAVGVMEHDDHVLQRVGRGPWTTVVTGEVVRPLRWSTSVAIVGVSGVSWTTAGGSSSTCGSGGGAMRTASTLAA